MDLNSDPGTRKAPAGAGLAGPPVAPSLSRRTLVAGAGAATFGAALAAITRRSFAAPAYPNDVPADVDPSSLVHKLVNRITFGGSESELALAESMGYEGYLEYQLNHTAIDDSIADARVAPLSTVFMSANDLFQDDDNRPTTSQIRNELTEHLTIRAVYGTRQLHERMVEMWTDHFNIAITDDDPQYLKTVDDRDVIRSNALGNFGTLLTASAHSPAMLVYLNNNLSTALSPNENYAREIMELHSLGVDGGYTQQDVVQVARCFSGWTRYGSASNNAPNCGKFLYSSGRHATGAKTVFAGTPQQLNIPNRSASLGKADGDDVLNALKFHPSTARFIATKICRHFVAEDPSSKLVDKVAAAYTSSGGDIKSMLRVALAPNVIAAAPPKFKRPFHLIVSALRALSANITSTTGLRSQYSLAGHAPYTWLTPDGYPDKLAHWSGLLLPRWNFGASLMNGTTGSVTGTSVDTAAFFSGATTPAQAVERISQRLFAGRMNASDRSAVAAYIGTSTSSTRWREAIGLSIASPGFQWY